MFRLLLVAAQYPPYPGGIGTHVDEVARRLARSGVNTTVLTTDPTGDLPERENTEGVEIRRVRAWPADRDYYVAPAIYREISRGGWDVVHVHSYLTFVGPLAMLAAWHSRTPYVVTFHAGGLAMLGTWSAMLPHIASPRAGSYSERVRYAIRPIQLSLVRPLLTRADHLIALARFEIDHYSSRLRIPRDRFALISNGSDLPQPIAAGSTARDDTLIASIGRLERYKGHQRVLAALPHIVRRRPEARLWIAGSGPYDGELRRLAHALDVADRVDIRAIPPQERQRMANELARVKVMTLLSDYEGARPIAALEALSLGCRLIVADAPGLADLAEEGLARSVPLDRSPEDIAAVILEELAQPRSAEPPALPTWDECAKALHDVYLSVLRSRSR